MAHRHKISDSYYHTAVRTCVNYLKKPNRATPERTKRFRSALRVAAEYENMYMGRKPYKSCKPDTAIIDIPEFCERTVNALIKVDEKFCLANSFILNKLKLYHFTLLSKAEITSVKGVSMVTYHKLKAALNAAGLDHHKASAK